MIHALLYAALHPIRAMLPAAEAARWEDWMRHEFQNIACHFEPTATEIAERQRAAEQEWNREHARRRQASFNHSIANRALMILGSGMAEQQPDLRPDPNAINWLSTSTVPLRASISADPYNTEKVDRKAKAALWRYLNEKQHEDLFCLGHFVVNGGKSKMVYKIMKGRQGNVHREDDARFCLTHGDLPVWDLMLAQKLMIEDSEPRFLELANDLNEMPF